MVNMMKNKIKNFIFSVQKHCNESSEYYDIIKHEIIEHGKNYY